MLNLNSADTADRIYQYVEEMEGDYFDSSEYSKVWDRYEKRIAAYYCRQNPKAAKWRSKLSLATFWLACKAYEAQFREAYRRDPMVMVTPIDNARLDPNSSEASALAHKDLNADLLMSGFRQKWFRAGWFVSVFGTAIGRESILSKQRDRRMAAPGPDGQMVELSQMQRIEHTVTDIIHPLNFAHSLTKNDIKESTWACTRWEMPMTDIYKMLGNPMYYQPGVKKAIEAMRLGQARDVEKLKGTFYVEHGSTELKSHFVVASEYTGLLTIKGNERDTGEYLVLRIPEYDATLLQIKNPCGRHPIWKIQAHPDPDGPYGVGPNDMVLPIKEWEDSTVNQYIDYVNSSLKYLYKVNPGNIVGGALSLLRGLPHGLVEAEEDPQAWNQMIEPIRKDMGSMSMVGDMVGMIEKYKERQGPSSGQRGQTSQQQPDTATGISLLAAKEDEMVASSLDNIDFGLKDVMQLKLDNRRNLMHEGLETQMGDDDGERMVRYHPYELRGFDFAFDVKRGAPDAEAGKNLSFLRLMGSMGQMLPIPPKAYVEGLLRVGQAMGIDGIDGVIDEIRQGMSVNAGSVGGVGSPVPPGPGAPAGPIPSPQIPEQLPGMGAAAAEPQRGVANAIALA